MDNNTNNNDETTRLVNDNNIRSNSNSQPIPANRLALDAQIQAAAEYQRRLRRRRSVYYIVLITSVTMLIFCILSFVAWVIHNSSGNKNLVQAKSLMIESVEVIDSNHHQNLVGNLNHFNARKHPTRTIKSEDDAIKKLIKRSERESDEEKDEELKPKKEISASALEKDEGRPPTRTRKLSFSPEKVIDYKANI